MQYYSASGKKRLIHFQATLQYNRNRGISDCTVRRLLNRNGFHHLQTREKGRMSASDNETVAFARRIINNYPPDVWTNKIAFYFDSVSFV